MKKMICILFSLIFLIATCSCGKNTQTGDEAANNAKDKKPAETDGLLLLDVSEDGVSDKFETYESARKYGVGGTSILTWTQLTDVEATKEHPLDTQKTLSYSYSKVLPEEGLLTTNDFYCAYDAYMCGDEKFVFLHGTDLLCLYTKSSNFNNQCATISENGAKEIADEFLSTILPESVLSKFVYERFSVDDLSGYVVGYSRYVCGYRTDEGIGVWIDRCGNVFGYNGYNVKKYDTLEGKLNKDAIKRTADALLTDLQSLNLNNLWTSEPDLTTGSDGTVYVRIHFTYEEGGFKKGVVACMKVA